MSAEKACIANNAFLLMPKTASIKKRSQRKKKKKKRVIEFIYSKLYTEVTAVAPSTFECFTGYIYPYPPDTIKQTASTDTRTTTLWKLVFGDTRTTT